MAADLKRRQTLDPAVAGILATHEQRQADVHLPPKERRKKAREREKMRRRQPGRATYDLPKKLKDRIAEIADESFSIGIHLQPWPECCWSFLQVNAI